jgi:glyoxylase-like metal-dependent hydrolase (beta-lactamase superfamily II)
MALGETMRVLRPYPHIYAFYDGRIPGVRAYAEAPNWLDDGAFSLGICSYAVVDGGEALVYDAHISIAHARRIRAILEADGVTSFRLVLSHWHDDHVAGNEVFADGEIIACQQTYEALQAHKGVLEAGEPPIKPLVMPNLMFDEALDVQVGSVAVELRHLDVHSFDGVVALIPEYGVLLAGDTLEDPITYVAEPERLTVHLDELGRLGAWEFTHILPNHGAPEVIAAGGYGLNFILATKRYIEKLLRVPGEPALAALDLQAFAKDAFAAGGIAYFAGYEAVHRQNVRKMLEQRKKEELLF